MTDALPVDAPLLQVDCEKPPLIHLKLCALISDSDVECTAPSLQDDLRGYAQQLCDLLAVRQQLTHICSDLSQGLSVV